MTRIACQPCGAFWYDPDALLIHRKNEDIKYPARSTAYPMPTAVGIDPSSISTVMARLDRAIYVAA